MKGKSCPECSFTNVKSAIRCSNCGADISSIETTDMNKIHHVKYTVQNSNQSDDIANMFTPTQEELKEREDLKERYEQMADEELEALLPVNLTDVALGAYKLELERRSKTECLKLAQKEEKDRRQNEARKTRGAEYSANQTYSGKTEKESNAKFDAVLHMVGGLILIVIGFSLDDFLHVINVKASGDWPWAIQGGSIIYGLYSFSKGITSYSKPK